MVENRGATAPQVGDQYYFRDGVAKVQAYSRGSMGTEFGASIVVAPDTVATVASVNDRNVELHAEGRRLKGNMEGHLVDQSRLPLKDVLSDAERIVTREELTAATTPRMEAWKAARDEFRERNTRYVPVEVVVGPTIPGEATPFPAEATIVELPTAATIPLLAAD